MLAQCEQLAGAFATLVKGRVALLEHPLMGARPTPDCQPTSEIPHRIDI